MLELKVSINERFDEETQEFQSEVVTLQLEHSLVSISKWESFFEISFFSTEDKTEQSPGGSLGSPYNRARRRHQQLHQQEDDSDLVLRQGS